MQVYLVSAGPRSDCPQRAPEDHEVEQHRPVLDVVQVKPDRILPLEVAAPVDAIAIHMQARRSITTERVQLARRPCFPGKRYEDWELEDPAGQGIESVRPIPDEIRARVLALLHELEVEPVELAV